MKEFEKEYVLRPSDFNYKLATRKASILDIFQDIAGVHSNYTGCGLFDFQPKNLGWVLVSVRFKIYKPFDIYTNVKVKTWPLKPSAAKIQREYAIYNLNGELCCLGESIWTVINLETRRIVPVRDINVGIEEFSKVKNFEEKFGKVRAPEQEMYEFIGERKVLQSDIDMNRHVNNIRYANFIVDTFGEDAENYTNFEIDYNKELTLGQTVQIFKASKDDKLYFKGYVGEDLIFTACYSNN